MHIKTELEGNMTSAFVSDHLPLTSIHQEILHVCGSVAIMLLAGLGRDCQGKNQKLEECPLMARLPHMLKKIGYQVQF